MSPIVYNPQVCYSPPSSDCSNKVLTFLPLHNLAGNTAVSNFAAKQRSNVRFEGKGELAQSHFKVSCTMVGKVKGIFSDYFISMADDQDCGSLIKWFVCLFASWFQ